MAKKTETAILDETYVPAILSDDDLEKQEANVAATRAAKAEADRAARETYLAPLVELASRDCIRNLYNGLRETREQYADDHNIVVHIDALLMILPNFASAAGVSLDAVMVSPEASPEVDPEA
jgi:hypothetical protein